ncbi:uncharacterized protein N7484_003216 [Penicillium longicatenatum]|uniref:uncharacterized protein n=1 Tax=Penicillium longicatenatum TaxID=1561947 RepID=UPI0025466ACE|nr:uncharacterized protein N7484_003216 [Penicillium longicatenatum]KAJ5649493.1 hypothetical protein N7484_003216 [Penicillium longicatenatum]
MPPRPGEEILVNVLADIHYYFTTPTPKPLYHRFEKGSYLYVYQDVSQNKSRIEIANNPGTPDQDAFQGTLDNVHISHSAQFPTLCTVTVDGYTGAPQQEASQYDWRLPSTDGQNDLIRLNTLDIYFWTLDDANQFLNSVSLVLANAQVETDRDSAAEQSDQPLSSVVQQLENVAVSDPAYQNGQTPDSRFSPPSVAVPTAQAAPASLSFPPPPPSGPSAEQPQSHAQHPSFSQERDSPVSPITPEERQEPENVAPAPLPYNPAAPAAPEPIKHREKTPPPPEDGTGLAAAAAADAGVPYTPPHQRGNSVGISSFAPPPSSALGMQYNTTGYASPPPSAGLAHSSTPIAGPGSSSALQSPVLPSYQQSFMNGQQFPGAGGLSFAPPPQDPNAHLFGQQMYNMPQQSPPQQAHQPPVGFSNYSYDQSQPQPVQRSGSEYDIHSQVYRPTQEEVRSHAQKHAHKAMKAPGERPHKIEDKAHKMEGGVNRFLKRLEKKLG